MLVLGWSSPWRAESGVDRPVLLGWVHAGQAALGARSEGPGLGLTVASHQHQAQAVSGNRLPACLSLGDGICAGMKKAAEAAFGECAAARFI